MCRIEKWSPQTLEKKISGMLYERTALSKKPDELIRQELAALREEDKLTCDLVFCDPYLLNCLGLKDTYAEKDLEAAILREIEAFVLELGVGFAFLERQRRVTGGPSIPERGSGGTLKRLRRHVSSVDFHNECDGLGYGGSRRPRRHARFQRHARSSEDAFRIP